MFGAARADGNRAATRKNVMEKAIAFRAPPPRRAAACAAAIALDDGVKSVLRVITHGGKTIWSLRFLSSSFSFSNERARRRVDGDRVGVVDRYL